MTLVSSLRLPPTSLYRKPMFSLPLRLSGLVNHKELIPGANSTKGTAGNIYFECLEKVLSNMSMLSRYRRETGQGLLEASSDFSAMAVHSLILRICLR